MIVVKAPVDVHQHLTSVFCGRTFQAPVGEGERFYRLNLVGSGERANPPGTKDAAHRVSEEMFLSDNALDLEAGYEGPDHLRDNRGTDKEDRRDSFKAN